MRSKRTDLLYPRLLPPARKDPRDGLPGRSVQLECRLVSLPLPDPRPKSKIVLKLKFTTWFMREGQWGTIQLRQSRIGRFSRA